MHYNFVADSFHTKILCSRLSSSDVRFYTENGRFAFLSPFGGKPPIGDSKTQNGRFPATYAYDVHLKFTGKLAVDLLLVLIDLFFFFSLGVTAEALRANIG